MQTNTAFTCAQGAGRVQVVDCEGLNLNILYDDSLKGYFTQPFQTSMHFFFLLCSRIYFKLLFWTPLTFIVWTNYFYTFCSTDECSVYLVNYPFKHRHFKSWPLFFSGWK